MNDYLSLIPSTLEWTSKQLGSISPIPWPLWIGLLFPIYVGFVVTSVWVLRGRVWPVRCAYAKTSRNRACREWVAGEWYRCRHHNKPIPYRYGHTVMLQLKRWQKVRKDGTIVDSEFHSSGLFRTRPEGSTLLYHNGFSREPGDVVRAVPTYLRKLLERARDMRLGVKSVRHAPTAAEASEEIESASGVRQITQATRFSLVAVILGLLLSGLALLIESDGWKAGVQWFATLAIVAAWAGTRSGIYLRREDWLRSAVWKSTQWWLTIFAPVAFLNLVFTWLN